MIAGIYIFALVSWLLALTYIIFCHFLAMPIYHFQTLEDYSVLYSLNKIYIYIKCLILHCIWILTFIFIPYAYISKYFTVLDYLYRELIHIHLEGINVLHVIVIALELCEVLMSQAWYCVNKVGVFIALHDRT